MVGEEKYCEYGTDHKFCEYIRRNFFIHVIWGITSSLKNKIYIRALNLTRLDLFILI